MIKMPTWKAYFLSIIVEYLNNNEVRYQFKCIIHKLPLDNFLETQLLYTAYIIYSSYRRISNWRN